MPFRAKLMQKIQHIYYYCNRSNIRDYQSNCLVRTRKLEGTIKIDGVCSSRIILRIHKNGECQIEYYKTHVGYDEEIRAQHLSKIENAEIIDKLKMDITAQRIIDDAKQLEPANKVTRLNLLNPKDLYYLAAKNGINKKDVTTK